MAPQLHSEVASLRAQLRFRDERLERVLMQNEMLQRRLEESMSNLLASTPKAAASGAAEFQFSGQSLADTADDDAGAVAETAPAPEPAATTPPTVTPVQQQAAANQNQRVEQLQQQQLQQQQYVPWPSYV